VEFSVYAITGITILEQNDTISRPEVLAALEQVPAAIIERQSTPVDVVTGATITSRRIVEAVKACMVQAETGQQ
jgi:uncharacterized protein with FMN-binding domain